MGWEVETDMSGQSNDCLRVHNVKMKKIFTGVETGHISENLQLTGCSINGFEFFPWDRRSGTV